MEGKLHLTTRDGRAIVIPTAQAPMLLGVESQRVVNLNVIQDGTCLRGIDPSEVLHVRSILKPSPDQETLTLKGPFPLPKVYGWIAAIAGIFSMVWLAVIPSDTKNAWVMGLSKTRLAMFLVGVGFLILIIYFLVKPQDDDSRGKTTKRLNAVLMRPVLIHWVVFLSALGVVGSLSLLLVSFLQVDPYLQGIFSRLEPWFAWSLVLFCEAVVLATSSLLRYSHSKMARAEDLSFQGDQLVVELQGEWTVRVPLSRFPALEEADSKIREAVLLLGDGLRLVWPKLGVDVFVEGLLAGGKVWDNG
jgi:hypothetical protein